ncbi:MAG: ABC transporter permease [Clostridium sp.]
MRNILLIIRGNILRLKKDKITLLMIIVVLPIIVGLGVYFGSTNDVKGKIAVINGTSEEQRMIGDVFKENEGIKVEFLNNEIKNTALITGAYLAELKFENGKVKVNEYSNDEIRKIIDSIFYGKEYIISENSVGVAEKITGFLMMFLFYGALASSSFFLQDRENGIYVRVLSGNISFFQYTLGQILYILLVVIVPASIISIGMIKALNVDINMSYGSFLGILILLGTLCSSMIILIGNIFKKTNEVQMNAAIIGMITSLFSGCLMNVEGGSKIIEGIRNILPQKRLLDFVRDFNNSDLIFVVSSIIIFLIIGIYIGSNNYKKGIFA